MQLDGGLCILLYCPIESHRILMSSIALLCLAQSSQFPCCNLFTLHAMFVYLRRAPLVNYGTQSNLYHWYIFHCYCLLAEKHFHLSHHTVNPLLQQPVRLTTSLLVGAKSWVCVVQVSTLFATPVWCFLPPTGSITSVSYWGKTFCCAASHLALGVPNRLCVDSRQAFLASLLGGQGRLHKGNPSLPFSLLCF